MTAPSYAQLVDTLREARTALADLLAWADGSGRKLTSSAVEVQARGVLAQIDVLFPPAPPRPRRKR